MSDSGILAAIGHSATPYKTRTPRIIRHFEDFRNSLATESGHILIPKPNKESHLQKHRSGYSAEMTDLEPVPDRIQSCPTELVTLDLTRYEPGPRHHLLVGHSPPSLLDSCPLRRYCIRQIDRLGEFAIVCPGSPICRSRGGRVKCGDCSGRRRFAPPVYPRSAGGWRSGSGPEAAGPCNRPPLIYVSAHPTMVPEVANFGRSVVVCPFRQGWVPPQLLRLSEMFLGCTRSVCFFEGSVHEVRKL
jgi:hypothetical protein